MRAKYIADLPRITKPSSFYQRHESQALAQSPNISVQMLAPPKPPTLSLKCPISMKVQSFPVRTVHCKHLETFDLGTFIDTISYSEILLKGIIRVLSRWNPVAPHTVVHTCPICSTKAPLYIDTIILGVLTLHPELASVMVTPSGQLIPCSSPSPHLSEVDLTSPSPYIGTDSVSPLPVFADPATAAPAPAQPKRRFSFGDLGTGCRIGRRYERLSTIDLTVDSPC